MDKKIKILFHTLDQAGVNYFRISSPAIQLDMDHSDKFHVDINPNIDWNNPNIIDYLKGYDIIHYHRQLHPEVSKMIKIAKELKDSGTKLVMDIDDYPYLDKTHPMAGIFYENKQYQEIIDNLKIADYITTTTEYFAEELRKITEKDNIIVLFNSINPDWQKQFQNNHTEDPDGKIRVMYMGGSSHGNDLKQLENVVNMLHTDIQTRNKFRIILSGFDCDGTTVDAKFNEEFAQELQKIGLWNQEIVNIVNKTRGDVDKLPAKVPTVIKNKYRGKVFEVKQRPIRSEESVYYQYEKILTDNYLIVKNNPEYIKYLMNFERVDNPPYNENYKRIFTKKANIYATALDQCDILLSPLADNQFNNSKSNLKQVECWSRRLPIICNDMKPYNVDGVDGENCLLIPNKLNIHKEWFKAIKKLIIDKELREKLGNGLYEIFSQKYHLKNVTNIRADFYQKIIINNNK